MKQRILFLIKLFALWLCLFVLAKPLFMAYNAGGANAGFGAGDVLQVVWHGLPLDIATAGYLLALPWLATLVSAWLRIPAATYIYKVYAGIVSALLALILVADACLYSFWGFKLDATVFNYLDSPKGMAASVSWQYLLVALAAVAAVGFGAYKLAARLFPAKGMGAYHNKILSTLALVIMGGLIFLGIRGGVGRSTANIGMVYYSDNQFLNHSAVNPAFSLFYSLGKTHDYSKECDYFDENTRSSIFASLKYDTLSTDTPKLLTTDRPNVVVVLMEGMAGSFVEAVGGMKGITPNLNRLAAEGVVFTNCYANSFRTDRGTVCALSGYPSFPDVSVMKVPAKSRTLPGIASSLAKAGYDTEFLYGGDINFTNMNSYFLSTGYKRTFGDTAFPLDQRRTHAWGVTDRITFDRLAYMISRKPAGRPWHIGFLTLASHEPWKVPYNRFPSDEIVNSMAYLDDCIGRFVQQLRKSPAWSNTLLVFIPDHGIIYPRDITEANISKYHIPMIWAGGAVRRHVVVNQVCNQTDLPATLLGQLGIAHGEFRFSRDVLSKSYAYPCAIHTWSGGVAFIDSGGHTVIDLTSGRTLSKSGSAIDERERKAKVFLQTCYDDLGSR